jgi:hypothetical protein
MVDERGKKRRVSTVEELRTYSPGDRGPLSQLPVVLHPDWLASLAQPPYYDSSPITTAVHAFQSEAACSGVKLGFRAGWYTVAQVYRSTEAFLDVLPPD